MPPTHPQEDDSLSTFLTLVPSLLLPSSLNPDRSCSWLLGDRMLPRNVTSATGCSFNPGGGVWRKRGRGWLGYGVHSGHEGESRGMSQNATVSPNLSIEEEVCMLGGAGDWGLREP